MGCTGVHGPCGRARRTRGRIRLTSEQADHLAGVLTIAWSPDCATICIGLDSFLSLYWHLAPMCDRLHCRSRNAFGSGRERDLATWRAIYSSNSPSGSENSQVENRVHRRVIICDHGVPIYKASSRVSMLSGFTRCIEGEHLVCFFLHRL